MIKYETITCTPLSMKLADATFGQKDAKISYINNILVRTELKNITPHREGRYKKLYDESRLDIETSLTCSFGGEDGGTIVGI